MAKDGSGGWNPAMIKPYGCAIANGACPLPWTPHLLEKRRLSNHSERTPYPPEFRQQMVELV